SHLTLSLLYFSNATPTTNTPTLSLHDALPISARCTLRLQDHHAGRRSGLPGARQDAWQAGVRPGRGEEQADRRQRHQDAGAGAADRKSTRLNSSHVKISYAVFCLKKKKIQPL